MSEAIGPLGFVGAEAQYEALSANDTMSMYMNNGFHVVTDLNLENVDRLRFEYAEDCALGIL